jgi:hypothetical protein
MNGDFSLKGVTVKKFVLIASALVLFLLPAAWAQAPATGTVNGSVTLNGAPLSNAAVVVSSSGSSSYTAKAATDANGHFTFANAPVGNVEVKAYDSQGVFLASGTVVLSQAGDVVSLAIAATR